MAQRLATPVSAVAAVRKIAIDPEMSEWHLLPSRTCIGALAMGPGYRLYNYASRWAELGCACVLAASAAVTVLLAGWGRPGGVRQAPGSD